MSRMNDGCGPIPNRWLNCPRKSETLITDKFMALKTPLSKKFDSKVPAECRFSPKMFFDFCKLKRIKIGLWIDLTNSTRFYDKSEVEDFDCRYVKIQCRGHGETPSPEQTAFFIQLVHKFIANNPLKSIAVHCTHGFNRTGFLIVCYLVEKMDFSLETALDIFAKARPHGIYKGDYVRELYHRYDDINDAPPSPTRPKWCLEGEDVDDDVNTSNDSYASTSRDFTNNKNHRHSTVAFMEGVPGVSYFCQEPDAHWVKKTVQRMCEWRTKGFPGSQPVSMDNTNIGLLHQKPYRVSWKADGMRYMMLIDGEDKVYFFDRDFNVFKVNGLRFLHRKDLRKHLTNTLLDGEMVIDKVDGEDIPRYLVYDIVKFENQDVGKMAFYPVRQSCIENEIIKPRNAAIENGIINKNAEPFRVRKKEFWPITQAASLLGEKFARALSHEPDGLIFQPSKEPYIAGRCDDVLKWKPLELNSIDFRLRIQKQEGIGIVSTKVCHLYVGQYEPPFATMKYSKSLRDLDNKIVECKFEENQWKFMRERTDKSYPNSFNTAKAVLGSIQNPITKEKLLDYIEENRFDDDSEIMPPPQKRIRR